MVFFLILHDELLGTICTPLCLAIWSTTYILLKTILGSLNQRPQILTKPPNMLIKKDNNRDTWNLRLVIV